MYVGMYEIYWLYVNIGEVNRPRPRVIVVELAPHLVFAILLEKRGTRQRLEQQIERVS
jgi:hypothetical protein